MSIDRKLWFGAITKEVTAREKALAEKRLGYSMPPGYIQKKDLVLMDLACSSFCSQARTNLLSLLSVNWDYIPDDFYTGVIFSKSFGMWSKNGGPLYCLTKEIMEPLNQTDSLSKKDILKDFNIPLHSLLIAIPKHSICTPTSETTYIDFLLINCFNPTGKRNTKIIGVFSVDTNADTWVVKTEIDMAGNIITDEHEAEKHKEFFRKIRNLVISILLVMDISGNSIIAEVAPAETSDHCPKHKGFGKNPIPSSAKYPRWIGKNYQQRTERQQVIQSKGSHSSPRTHWRRGHFRRLEPGEGKKWTDQKTLWIEPVLVKGSIE